MTRVINPCLALPQGGLNVLAFAVRESDIELATNLPELLFVVVRCSCSCRISISEERDWQPVTRAIGVDLVGCIRLA